MKNRAREEPERTGNWTDTVPPRASTGVTVRRKPVWRPMLRPAQDRRLPPDLFPDAVYHTAEQFAGGLADVRFRTLVQRIDQSPFHCDSMVTPFFDGISAFTAMLQAIKEAREEVLVEAYILHDDLTGRDFLAALKLAADRGVRVKALADAFGSSRTHRRFWATLRESGTLVRLFRRPLYAPQRWLPVLDHRKLLIVDRKIAFTGGMNIADEYRGGRPGEQPWRDTHVALQGGVAWDLTTIFGESWMASGGDPMESDVHVPDSVGGVPALVMDSRPGRGQSEVFSIYATVMGACRERLWITNAYFAPGRRMVRLLKSVAARGIDVRLLLPGRSDIPIIKMASQGYYKELLAAGIRIYEYQAAVLHAKTLVADGQLAIIGSTNFDFRSFHYNAECNVLLHDAGVAEQVEAAFLEDLERSCEINWEDWKRRHPLRRLLGWLTRFIAPLI